jgi:hypothetical protein
MKKFLTRFLLMFVMLFTFSSFADAQTALQTSKITDNVYVGAHTGVSIPISRKNPFPVNPFFGLTVGKEISPVVGFNIEGTTWMGSHSGTNKTDRFDYYVAHNAIRAINVGANMSLNLRRLFSGYVEKPYLFEYGIEGGFGWLNTMIPHERNLNDLSAKTQINLKINMGKSRAHTLGISPTLWWNLTEGNKAVSFNSRDVQFGIAISYIYHFKNSHGTHYFKVYDVGKLQEELDYCKSHREVIDVPETPKKVVEVFEFDKVVEIPAATVIYFAWNDATLDAAGMAELDKFPAGASVHVIGTASPEGTEKRNMELSQMRADVVADYLRARGVEVTSAEGKGVATGATSNRVAIVMNNTK